ncbi:MAG TPA: hypothetical protein VKR06_33830 [Ktedonosporobacter sp.]|nr:hypothetical protein [Ktedonosporobacter sp.]
MGKKRKSQKGKRYTRYSLPHRQSMWSWTSRGLLVRQRAWLSLREQDSYQPPHHYNLHVQPLSGGHDYHNYHIRYLGTQGTQHLWSVVDAPSGITRSCRIYTFSKRLFIREVIDIASSMVVADITNDIGDPSIWMPLSEHLSLALRDLYQHGKFAQNKPARRKS